MTMDTIETIVVHVVRTHKGGDWKKRLGLYAAGIKVNTDLNQYTGQCISSELLRIRHGDLSVPQWNPGSEGFAHEIVAFTKRGVWFCHLLMFPHYVATLAALWPDVSKSRVSLVALDETKEYGTNIQRARALLAPKKIPAFIEEVRDRLAGLGAGLNEAEALIALCKMVQLFDICRGKKNNSRATYDQHFQLRIEDKRQYNNKREEESTKKRMKA